ncbi:MAG: hypothetical protein B6D41_20540 [Chloroflexi bacterium UTCFX4]|nr:MAG: hypothetical protein B6D41_20540 [Chloroflexi bacterium UTCFX4]
MDGSSALKRTRLERDELICDSLAKVIGTATVGGLKLPVWIRRFVRAVAKAYALASVMSNIAITLTPIIHFCIWLAPL